MIQDSQEIPLNIAESYSKYKKDSSSFQNYTMQGENFELDSKYQFISQVQNQFVAVKNKNHEDEENLLCIKKVKNAFDHKVFAQNTLRKLKFLRLLKHENVLTQINSYLTKILNLREIQLPKSRQEFNEIYLVSELMEADLNLIIKSQQELTNQHVQFFLYQILRGLKYIHSANVIHRNLKPNSLYVNSNCDLKIGGFSMAKLLHQDIFQFQNMTPLVSARWYRAPELLLQNNIYGKPIDIWSVGCIFAELLGRKPLFPGTDLKNQFKQIFQAIGTPTKEEFDEIASQVTFSNLYESLPQNQGQELDQIFANATDDALSLLKKMLVFDPKKRITIEQALEDPYLQELHCLEDEPPSPCYPLEINEFEFEMFDLNIQQLKDCIYEEILLYHFQEFRNEYQMKKNLNESLISHILEHQYDQLERRAKINLGDTS